MVICWKVSFKGSQAATVELVAVEVGEDLGISLVVGFPFPCYPAILTIASSNNSIARNPIVGCLDHRIHSPGAITKQMIHEAGARGR